MNEDRFNACCDGCYYRTGCTNGHSTESGGEKRWKGKPKPAPAKKRRSKKVKRK